MLEKPPVPDDAIIAVLQAAYGWRAVEWAFLPLGADRHTAVYRARAGDGRAYFVKLRSGDFDPMAVTLPRFLHDQGIRAIIPPLATTRGGLWAEWRAYRLLVYPFVEGHNGYDVALAEQHWRALGQALYAIHTCRLPPGLTQALPVETYAPPARNAVRRQLSQVGQFAHRDPIASQLADLLTSQRGQILDLLARAEHLAQRLRATHPAGVVCHTDLHAGNILIDVQGNVFIVDWDNPRLAPKERDLMFVGGGQFANARPPAEEEALFYQGYGPTHIDTQAIAYFRYQRIIEDIAAFCDEIVTGINSAQDRAQALRYLASNFRPGNTIAIAYQADRTAH